MSERLNVIIALQFLLKVVLLGKNGFQIGPTAFLRLKSEVNELPHEHWSILQRHKRDACGICSHAVVVFLAGLRAIV